MLEVDELQSALPKVTMPLPGPKAKAVLSNRSENVPAAVLCHYPVVINRGSGAMIEDIDGNHFLDWVAGVGVMNVGYGQQKVIDAVKQQADRYFHSMINITTHSGYVDLAARLNALAPVKGAEKQTMFVNSGAEAVENAVKIAKSYTGRGDVIVFSGAFHGRTALTSTMTAKKTYSSGIEPAMGGIYRAAFPYLYRAPKGYSHDEAIQYYLNNLQDVFEQGIPAKQVAAIVIEPIQGEGGFIPAPFEYVKALRQICDQNGILLIADEVQSGFARSGKLFVSNYWQEGGFAPDIIACAKSIGAGLPLAAVIASKTIMAGIQPGIVGSTFGGNALATAAGLQVLDIIRDQKLTDRALQIGHLAFDGFSALKEKYAEIGDVRGIGSMIGVEFVKDRTTKDPYPELVAKLIHHAISHGLIIENAGVHDNVIRFLSPLVATEAQTKAGLQIFETSLKEALAEL